ncbi:hypothetical protein AB3N02_22695 [Priestia aryabhattai]|uniref:hypothetical protein n=1 Tax=Priestia aryabhattai TaxID=412384 RepID=UPI0039A1115E
MKVVIKTYESEDMMYNSLEITIDKAIKFKVESSEDSPEDNTLHRNFSDCYEIPALLKKAYEAGKNGDKFEIHYEDDEQ